MPIGSIRYELDPTGVNPDNLVTAEVHELSGMAVRAVTPTYAPYFTESLEVYDATSNLRLTRGIHYQCVTLSQEATLRYGKELCSVILIVDRSVSNTVRINYQTLGGLYVYDASAVATMYENVMKDNRPVDWVNVLNKPTQYPPTLHNHLLNDLYGFEALTDVLERIQGAITLARVPAFEAVLDYLSAQGYAVSEKEVLSRSPSVTKTVPYDKLLVFLSERWTLSNFKITNIPDTVYEGYGSVFEVRAREPIPDGTALTWQVHHIGTQPDDFVEDQGYITFTNNRAYFTLMLRAHPVERSDRLFQLCLKEEDWQEAVIYLSPSIMLTNRARADRTIPSSWFFSPPNDYALTIEPLDATALYHYYYGNRSTQTHIAEWKLAFISAATLFSSPDKGGLPQEPLRAWDLALYQPDIPYRDLVTHAPHYIPGDMYAHTLFSAPDECTLPLEDLTAYRLFQYRSAGLREEIQHFTPTVPGVMPADVFFAPPYEGVSYFTDYSAVTLYLSSAKDDPIVVGADGYTGAGILVIRSDIIDGEMNAPMLFAPLTDGTWYYPDYNAVLLYLDPAKDDPVVVSVNGVTTV